MEEAHVYYILSILFGLIPDVLYFTLFLTYVKNLKEKRIMLFLLIAISYAVCMIIPQYDILCYLLFMALVYSSLKILYKTKAQIIDVFIIGIAYLWQVILSLILPIFAMTDLSNYYILYIINLVLLFSPFIFKNKFHTMYKKYCRFWNRNDAEKRPIKSITLRNISLILLNGLILLLNMTIINIINFISKVRC